jgi:uncharacterized membrane protein
MALFKSLMRVLYGAAFIYAGVNHFTNRDFFTAIVPPYLPWPVRLVYVSGVAEILLGALLALPQTAPLAAWGLIALLVAVFPANLHMAMNPQLYPDIPRAALWLRLPLQAVFIAIAYWFTGPVRNPVSREPVSPSKSPV